MPTESTIQEALYNWRFSIQPLPLMLPNVYHFNWESDLLYVSGSGYLTEYEIKISRSDFKQEAKTKHHKFFHMESGMLPNYGPTYFYYACQPDLIKADEVPEYAGLLYVDVVGDLRPSARVETIKKPQRRRVQPITERRLKALLKKSVARYWSLRETKRWQENQLAPPMCG